MNITMGQVTAFGRHVVTYGTGFVSALVVTHIASPEQGTDATNAITQISSGVASIYAGATTLIGLGSALWATVSASLKSQIKSVQAAPDAQVTVTDPKLATPGVKVVDKLP